jgi:hypothetical protein
VFNVGYNGGGGVVSTFDTGLDILTIIRWKKSD